MKYLIVSADDFGLTKSINEGVIKAFKEGIVTNINFLPTGEAFEDALKLAGDIKLKEAAAHLALTGTVPVSGRGNIPTLVSERGRFFSGYVQFFLKFFLGKINSGEIYTELKNQLEVLKRTGIRITSLSSHEHVHMLPPLLKIFIKLAKEYNIPSIRYPRNDMLVPPLKLKKMYKKLILTLLDKGMASIMKESGIFYTDSMAGFLDSGSVNEDLLIDMLSAFLEKGTTELVVHPGFLGPEVLDRYRFHLNCETELFALTSPRIKRIIQDRNIKLITYGELLQIR